MKTTFVKAVTGIFFVICTGGDALAAPLLNTTDTNRIVAAAEKHNKTTVLKEANVIYPEIFCGHEEMSIGYVENFSVSRREYLMRTYTRGKKYFPKVVDVLKKHNVPTEYKVLLAMESGFNGNARSGAGAVGYWQFMDDVAKEYGLRIAERPVAKTRKKGTKKQKKTDDRKDFNRSTYAAAQYLRDRARNLNNDWLLIAASYNCGVGNVWNAIKKTGKSTASFWEIKNYLPKETRAYVMNFIALNVIFLNYEKFAKNDLCFRTITAKENGEETDAITGQILND